MRIHHIAIWTFRLGRDEKEFYTCYFNRSSNEKYINPQKGLNLISFTSMKERIWNGCADTYRIPLLRKTDWD